MTRCVPVTGFAHYVLFYAAARKSLEALAGDRSLSGAQRGSVLWPSGLAPHGLSGVVLHLTGPLQRAADDGRNPF